MTPLVAIAGPLHTATDWLIGLVFLVLILVFTNFHR